MKNIVYAKNPLLAMIPKNESPEGFAGKYIPRGYGDDKSGKIGGSCNANPEVIAGLIIRATVERSG